MHRSRSLATQAFTSTVFAGVLLLFCACSVAPRPEPVPPPLDGVRLSFSNLGASPDLGQLHLAETSTPRASTLPGKDYWLRLDNASPFTVSFSTQSMYLSKPAEFVPIGPSSRVFAVANNAEVAVLFVSFEGLVAYGDMYSESFLPAGRSIFFSVPRRYLRGKRSIYVDLSAYTPAVLEGTEKPSKYRVYFSASQLPR